VKPLLILGIFDLGLLVWMLAMMARAPSGYQRDGVFYEGEEPLEGWHAQ